jgi:hypothetical protein
MRVWKKKKERKETTAFFLHFFLIHGTITVVVSGKHLPNNKNNQHTIIPNPNKPSNKNKELYVPLHGVLQSQIQTIKKKKTKIIRKGPLDSGLLLLKNRSNCYRFRFQRRAHPSAVNQYVCWYWWWWEGERESIKNTISPKPCELFSLPKKILTN